MGLNWFEGGRRVTYLFQGFAALCGALYIVFDSSEPVVFETHGPDENFSLTYESCDAPDAPMYLAQPVEFSPGDSRRVMLCFRRFGERGEIPYLAERIPGPPVMGSAPHTPPSLVSVYRTGPPEAEAVMAYMYRRYDIFRNSSDWLRVGRDHLWGWRIHGFWERLKGSLPWVFGIVIFLSTIAIVLGWIVRGFAGIPMGRDFRPPKEA